MPGSDGDASAKGWLARLNRGYLRGLDWMFEHRVTVLMMVTITTMLTYVLLPKGLFPEQDTGLIEGISLGSPRASFERMAASTRTLAGRVANDSAVASVSSFVDIDQNNPTINRGRMLITLKDGDANRTLIQGLTRDAAQRANLKLYPHLVQDLTLDDQINANSYRIGVQATDRGELNEWTQRLLDALRADPMFTDVQSRAQQQGNVLKVRLRPRDGAAAWPDGAGTQHKSVRDSCRMKVQQLPASLALDPDLGHECAHVDV
ncbi:efflux RND transporter permease subunit [Paraburkholderia tropica]|uniref:efflux RND transporter permease subunit n=1 Tax=Paraburkholderia tropica TaxID=92647 RepID=UPI002AAF8C4F|nr:efflux RND transporter permease subunit [Paraburkholderia tropica]